MEWRDEGILLTVRRHGESSAIIEVLTHGHGRHAGVVRGGGSRRMAPILQPGARLALDWQARLEDHIGTFRVDPKPSNMALILSDRAALAALGSISALVTASLPEREAHPQLYATTLELVESLAVAQDWPCLYAAWELALLAELGFGLDFSRCAATGGTEDLVWVSPRSGCAVSREGGAPWADKLLPLPEFLRSGWDAAIPVSGADLAAAFRLTGHFLEARLGPSLARERVPAARGRAVDVILRRHGHSDPLAEAAEP
ncbi:DNA repair protein RecO [Amaricoccus macauensis]|uniref:DNA repair protein RecO n=1 Tax=Amaricoccus macauensis TaxID=57001 RepID=UPI003C7E85C7